jgi:hypothetical protein
MEHEPFSSIDLPPHITKPNRRPFLRARHHYHRAVFNGATWRSGRGDDRMYVSPRMLQPFSHDLALLPGLALSPSIGSPHLEIWTRLIKLLRIFRDSRQPIQLLRYIG